IRTHEPRESQRDMTLAEFKGLVRQFPVLERVVLHGIGEPLLNSDLGAMIRLVKTEHPAAQVLFNSNAVLLDEAWQTELIDARLDEFRVSIDGASADTYARIRGIDALDTVIGNLRSFVSKVGSANLPRISFWLTAMHENLPELPMLVDLAAELGVQEVYAQRLVLFEQGMACSEQSPYGQLRDQEEAALAEAARRAAKHEIAFRASGLVSPQESLRGKQDESKPWSACFRPWNTTYVTANGNVLPCCISPFSTADYSELVHGNVFEKPFAEIWNGAKYVQRRAALGTDQPLEPCGRCGVHWSL
ncbi:MAG TPA: radical SAM/SPASM domain-containing protein, partial [Anaerolineae bacterium]|nr:radical SAM/SPASM domain-containing protein [Anaerolineae bacterium]